MPGSEPIAPITRKRMKGSTFNHDLAPRALPCKLAAIYSG